MSESNHPRRETNNNNSSSTRFSTPPANFTSRPDSIPVVKQVWNLEEVLFILLKSVDLRFVLLWIPIKTFETLPGILLEHFPAYTTPELRFPRTQLSASLSSRLLSSRHEQLFRRKNRIIFRSRLEVLSLRSADSGAADSDSIDSSSGLPPARWQNPFQYQTNFAYNSGGYFSSRIVVAQHVFQASCSNLFVLALYDPLYNLQALMGTTCQNLWTTPHQPAATYPQFAYPDFQQLAASSSMTPRYMYLPPPPTFLPSAQPKEESDYK